MNGTELGPVREYRRPDRRFLSIDSHVPSVSEPPRVPCSPAVQRSRAVSLFPWQPGSLEDRAGLRQAWAEMLLRGPEAHWWVRLTFEQYDRTDPWRRDHRGGVHHSISPEYAWDCLDRWLPRLRREKASGRIPWFAILEYGSIVHTHLHLIISRPGRIQPEQAKDLWFKVGGGQSKIEHYNPLYGGVYYLVEKLANPKPGILVDQADEWK